MFFQKALKTSQAFVNSYFAKIKQDSQYQLKETLDWTISLAHCQVVFKQFNVTAASYKETQICFFYKKQYLFIQVQLNLQELDLDLWKEVVEKPIDIKVKTNLQLFSGTRKIDFKYPKNYKLSAKIEKNKAS